MSFTEKSPEALSKRLVEFLDSFQGEFDNYEQVVEDWQQGLRPREHGGHEHMHCRLVPLTNTTRIACFYLDGNPQTIFRLRYYALRVLDANEHELLVAANDINDTKRHRGPFALQQIYTLHPKLEAAIRLSEPSSWNAIIRDYVAEELRNKKGAEGNDIAKGPNTIMGELHHQQLVAAGAIQYLDDCDVIWSSQPHPTLHSYCRQQQRTNANQQFHALLRTGDEIVVPSQYNPEIQIRIQDQLSLFPDTLYIHDRGRDATTNAWLYGNRRGVPYILQRCTAKLDWTLGTSELGVLSDAAEYQAKMDAMGGPTAGRRAPPTTGQQTR